MAWFILSLTIIFLLFAFVVAFGAPYLPTLNKQTESALDLLDLKPGQTLLELGSGDGRVLIAAAERDLIVIGYELNPILVIFSKLRTRKYGKKVKIIWGNYWTQTLPDADGVFVFLLQKYMKKLDKKITQEKRRKVKLVSFAFKVPDKKIEKEQNGLFLYSY